MERSGNWEKLPKSYQMLSEILEYGLKLNFLVKSLDCLKLSNLLGETCPMVIFENLGPFFKYGPNKLTWVHFFLKASLTGSNSPCKLQTGGGLESSAWVWVGSRMQDKFLADTWTIFAFPFLTT